MIELPNLPSLPLARRGRRALLVLALLGLAALPFFLSGPTPDVEASLTCTEPDYSNCVYNCVATLLADNAVCETLYAPGPQLDNCLFQANLSCDTCLQRCEFMHCKLPV